VPSTARVALDFLRRPPSFSYGSHRWARAELWLPSGSGPFPVVVVLHGGYWRARYWKRLMKAACADLARRGFDIGGHTYDHPNLGELDAAGVQREIVLGDRMISDAVPEAVVDTFALPYGVYPKRHQLAMAGRWDGQSYRFRGVFEVGSGPAPSPYRIDFDRLAIPRIKVAPWKGKPDFGSGYWLTYLEDHPDHRFVSDGNRARISFPAVLGGAVARRFRSRANPY